MKKELPEFHVEISHPQNKYIITPIFDRIKTLEGGPARLPYGHTSGEWASSGASFTAQNGTPIGFEFTYFSDYENKYYYIINTRLENKEQEKLLPKDITLLWDASLSGIKRKKKKYLFLSA